MKTTRFMCAVAAVLSIALGSCASKETTVSTQSRSETTTSDTSSVASVRDTDPGVDAFDGQTLYPPPSDVKELAEHSVVIGEITKESVEAPSGEMDNYLAGRQLSVTVTRVIHGTLQIERISLDNGVYEWPSDPGATPDVNDARRLTHHGQPWLAPGDKVLLVLDDYDDPRIKVSPERFGSFGAVGTYRLVDGRVDPSPRTTEMLRETVSHDLVGLTPDEVAKALADA